MLVNIRIDFKIADVATMEKSYDKLDRLIEKVHKNVDVKEEVVLKTCNRYEVYMILERDINIPTTTFIVEKSDVAVNHLLRLASGLESMIMGEDQILGQIKTARKNAIKNNTIGPKLEKVFTKAIHVGQSIRKNTHINEGGVSVGSGAVELIEEKYGSLKGKNVLIVGAGEMGTVVSKALLEKDTNAIVVANRTYDKAQQLAQELDGHAIKFNEMNDTLSKIDIVISATGAPHTLINKERLSFLPQEHLSNMIMLDLANPRDIDDDVIELSVQLYNLDDLRYITDKNKERRVKEAEKAEKIIEKETVLLKDALKEMEITPILSSLNIEAEKIRKQELEKTLHMLDISKKDSKKLDHLTRSITDKLMYNIINNLKKAAIADDIQTINDAKKILIEYPEQ
ncbi:glutamyl-tRNA reductase [Methanosphaera sp. Vir-13MRS]|mgnify:CR=1 FL=1|jgi:glutamyl-tRNA reductase|uniref:glutamyl-tRNA reductase n=1 Tax=Candidatus Methanosphaera massiliense TaxID=3017187 RepID=UPI00237FE263|nr:glutamyl-tRNA reductase [Candidatus Methanosphaera massiliense]MDE4077801.1 glutamyl-tRNA reductase [Candidatus Methanosphaera massiliense]MDY2744594.1 glutamyl-tRNA reductase [Methanosphaera sp.]